MQKEMDDRPLSEDYKPWNPSEEKELVGILDEIAAADKDAEITVSRILRVETGDETFTVADEGHYLVLKIETSRVSGAIPLPKNMATKVAQAILELCTVHSCTTG